MLHASRFLPRRAYRTEPSEDSDLVVALFRFAIIIAFSFSSGLGPVYTVGWPATIALIVAAVYTLLLMLAYVYSRQWMTQRRRQEMLSRPLWGMLLRHRIAIQRVSAIVVDLGLLTAIIADLSRLGYVASLYFDFYFVVVAVAAIWFHREGGVIAALAATLCVAFLIMSMQGQDIDIDTLRTELPARALMFLAAGVVTGYLARALDAERRHRERMEWELNMARQVQAAMLPAELPQPTGYELGAAFAPASVVGGDYYDALIRPDGSLFIAVADIAGKSVYGVMHLSLLRSGLREAVVSGLSPNQIAHHLNETLCKTLPAHSFVSLFCGALDLSSGKLQYANCGHVPPVLLVNSEQNDVQMLFTGNIVLGVKRDAKYDEATATLKPGSVLICCTDGLTDAMSPEWEAFNATGVITAAAPLTHQPATTIAETIVQAAQRHRKLPPSDDMTVLVVRRLSTTERN